jgi:hypothetical protein
MVKKKLRTSKKEKKQEEYQDHKSKDTAQPIDEYSFRELHIDWTLRDAFTRDEPLTREEYENSYVLPPYGAVAYRRTPTYEEYRQLYEKYCSERKRLSEFYVANMS